MLSAKNKRRHERKNLAIPVRYALGGNRELSGKIKDICEGGFFITPNIAANVGDTIIAYPEGLGRLSGSVARADKRGFAVKLNLSESQKGRLATRVAAMLAGVPYVRILDRRIHTRLALELKTAAQILPDGPMFDCVVVGLSGETLSVRSTDKRPSLGADIRIGGLVGRVCERHPDGFVLKVVDLDNGARKTPALMEKIWLNSTFEHAQTASADGRPRLKARAC